MTLSEQLTWRGFVNQTTFKDITDLDKQPITFYWGVDPSADSMHIGQLAMSMMIRHFIKYGHKPILLVGGATGLIGDPDGKDKERDLKSEEEVAANKAGIAAQYKQLFDGYDVTLVDNYDWFKDIGYLQFLRDVGKHVPMRQMLGREFVQSRLGEEGAGISYAEFSYALIQGYDFLHLHREHGATMQVCGSDQWGNSIAGVELIRRIDGAEAHIWSAPLVINKATGKKFGKSEDGAVWLDPAKTSPFKFYQFWINADDLGVEDYLKIFTELDKDSLGDIMDAHKEAPSNRLAQKRLAYEVTQLVHGKDTAESVQKVSEVLFGGADYATLAAQDFEALSHELTTVQVDNGAALLDVLTDGGLASSKGEARRFLQDSAIYINGSQFSSEKSTLESADAMHGYVVLRRGKNNTILVKIN